ncbi:MAG: hypothetical protein M3024_13660 [Candidatus Dormibacteraeota bacterium]|nr:hypothetical protein [Candidatus Dormibacteraeota bacterium]
MARLLGSMQRDGNVVSAVLRDAWDGGDLMVTSKNTGERATGAHVALISHITADELRQKLPDVEMANGFANRIPLVRPARAGGGGPGGADGRGPDPYDRAPSRAVEEESP